MLKPKCDEPLSCFAFEFNLRRYTKAAYHVGSPVHRMVRFRLKAPAGAGAGGGAAAPGAPTPAQQKAAANRHAVFFGTLDGGLGILVGRSRLTLSNPR